MAKYFRFEDLDIWKEAIRISIILLDIADELEEKKLWRFTDQLRGVSLSISNNIAESTGSNMVKDQKKSLRIAKKRVL
jgi:four helix bundle protein